MILLSSSGSVLFSAIVVFLIVMLFLVGILLYAKKKLTPSGSVKLDINDGKRVLEVERGGTVLNTLSNNKIFLPRCV